jgi:hypothetical protein
MNVKQKFDSPSPFAIFRRSSAHASRSLAIFALAIPKSIGNVACGSTTVLRSRSRSARSASARAAAALCTASASSLAFAAGSCRGGGGSGGAGDANVVGPETTDADEAAAARAAHIAATAPTQDPGYSLWTLGPVPDKKLRFWPGNLGPSRTKMRGWNRGT